MELPKLEPMRVGRILARSCRLYVENFWRFLAMAAVCHIPLTIILATHVLHLSSDNTSPLSGRSSVLSFVILHWIFKVGLRIGIRMVSWLSGNCVSGAVFAVVSRDYLGHSTGVWQAYRFVWPKFKTILTASVLLSFVSLLSIVPSTVLLELEVEVEPIIGLLVAYACLLLVIILTLWFVVTPYCIVAEEHSAWRSMLRSKVLVKANMGRILGLGVLLIVIYVGIFWITKYLVVGPVLQSITENSMMVTRLRGLFVSFICAPLFSLAGSLLYYDLRARNKTSTTT